MSIAVSCDAARRVALPLPLFSTFTYRVPEG